MELVGIALILSVVAFVIYIIYFIFSLPGKIARKRGLSDDKIAIIVLLEIVGVLIFLLWFVALGLAVFQQPERKSLIATPNNIDALEKLFRLKEQGIITEEEFQEERKRIMGR